MQIDADDIWWNEEEDNFQPYDKFKTIQPYEYNMFADEHNMGEDGRTKNNDVLRHHLIK